MAEEGADRGNQPTNVDLPAGPASSHFVPAGVNAASWLDFEQRIQARRFRALLDTAERAFDAGDGIAARSALDEARELRPDSNELALAAARVALVPPPSRVIG